MKKIVITIVFVFASLFSFGQSNFGKPEVDPIVIQSKFMDWWTYQSKNIMLSTDFIALDETQNTITKEAFLSKLNDGTTIPIRLQSQDTTLYYQLFKIETTSDTSIKATITQIAFDELQHLKMEGSVFPKFSFTDLNGNIISNESLKGKIIVIKCWYIHCAPCIKEFPDVNQLVERYKDRKDIVFVSFAEDTLEQLKLFLAKKPLSYSVIPNMKIYMNETLHLNAFPKHFIINKEGKIAKVLPNFESLDVALEKESKL